MTDLKQKFPFGSKWTHTPSGNNFIVVGVQEENIFVVQEGVSIPQTFILNYDHSLAENLIPYKEPRTKEVTVYWHENVSGCENFSVYELAHPLSATKIIAKKTITLTEGEGL